MKEMNVRKTKALLYLSVFWILCAIAALTSATYAWFTASPAANITPMEGSVSGGDGNLLISNRPDTGFDTTCELVLSSTTETLHPLSTADLSRFYTGTFQDPNGMTVRFADVSGQVDSSALHGTVYLRSEGGASDIYFNPNALFFGEDAQALGAMRLGMKISGLSGTVQQIFRLDAMGDVSGIRERQTVAQTDVVVASVGANGEPAFSADPAQSIDRFFAGGDETTVLPGAQKLYSIQGGEVITVEYWLYLEGCDPNCINDVQNRALSLQLGFAGAIG